MTLLFFGGLMNLWWIAGLAAYVLLEKLMPMGHWLGYAVGAGLAGRGAWLLVSSDRRRRGPHSSFSPLLTVIVAKLCMTAGTVASSCPGWADHPQPFFWRSCSTRRFCRSMARGYSRLNLANTAQASGLRPITARVTPSFSRLSGPLGLAL
jgi:hypothetical protein